MISGHLVKFVDDSKMPEGHDWMIVEADGDFVCVLRQSRVCPLVLEEAWAGYRTLAAEDRHGLDADERRRLMVALQRIEALAAS
jgi:hypothetical protein